MEVTREGNPVYLGPQTPIIVYNQVVVEGEVNFYLA